MHPARGQRVRRGACARSSSASNRRWCTSTPRRPAWPAGWCCVAPDRRSSSPTPGRSSRDRSRSAEPPSGGSAPRPGGPIRVICGSEGELRSGRDAGIGADLVCVPNAIDAERFGPADDDDRRAARTRLGLPSGPLAVCIGRLSEQKGQDLLLEAWPSVLDAVPWLGWSSSGTARHAPSCSGPRPRTWCSSVRSGEVYRLPGRRGRGRPEPSRYETLSLSMLEAMGRCRTVVATDVQGAREALVQHSSPAGAVVPLGDARALADAMVRRLVDPALAAREGLAGRAAVDAATVPPRLVR